MQKEKSVYSPLHLFALGNSGFKCFLCRSGTNKVCLFGFHPSSSWVCLWLSIPVWPVEPSAPHLLHFSGLASKNCLRKKVAVSCKSLETRAALNNCNSEKTPLCPQFLLHRKQKHVRLPQGSQSAPARRTWGGVGTTSIKQESYQMPLSYFAYERREIIWIIILVGLLF